MCFFKLHVFKYLLASAQCPVPLEPNPSSTPVTFPRKTRQEPAYLRLTVLAAPSLADREQTVRL